MGRTARRLRYGPTDATVAPARRNLWWVFAGGRDGFQASAFPWRVSCIESLAVAGHVQHRTRSRDLAGVCAPAPRGVGIMWAELQKLAISGSSGRLWPSDMHAPGARPRYWHAARQNVARQLGRTTPGPKHGSFTIR